jgi:hypothetical protein
MQVLKCWSQPDSRSQQKKPGVLIVVPHAVMGLG